MGLISKIIGTAAVVGVAAAAAATGMYLFNYWNGPAPKDDRQQQNDEKENEVEQMIENKNINEEKESVIHQTVSVSVDELTKFQNDIEIKRDIYRKRVEEFQRSEILETAAHERSMKNLNFVGSVLHLLADQNRKMKKQIREYEAKV